MRFISTRVHGLLDYLVSVLLISAPWVLGFADNGAETWIFVFQGIFSIIYSLFTDYERGLVRVLNMQVHLYLDIAGATILAVSPWLFGFAEQVYLPHVAFAAMEFLVIVFSQTVPKDREIPKKRIRHYHFGHALLHK